MHARKRYTLLPAFKGCGAVIYLCKQCGRVLPFLFNDDLRHRLRKVWRDVEGFNPQDTYSKLAAYQSLVAVPFDLNVRAPVRLPRHLHLNLSQHVLRNVGLRAHTSAETAL